MAAVVVYGSGGGIWIRIGGGIWIWIGGVLRLEIALVFLEEERVMQQ